MERLLFTAKLAERAERWDEMVGLIRKAVTHTLKEKGEVTGDLRGLFAVGFKNAISQRRTGWRILEQAMQKEQARGLMHGVELIQDYRMEIQQEIHQLCQEGFEIAGRLHQATSDATHRACFTKMKADFKRYMAELNGPSDPAAQEALHLYDEALHGIPPDHHVALSIALNKAIMMYEVMGQKDAAISLLQDRLSQMPPNDRSRKTGSVIGHLMEDNLRLWQSGKC